MPCFICRRAFTLIELMIVIGIVGILILILLPALQSARETAQLALCLNNEKQHSVAANVFAVEHRDTLPGTNWDNGSRLDLGTGWLYDPAEVQARGEWTLEGGQLLEYVGVDEIWRCPMDDPPQDAVGVRQISSYVMNGGVSAYALAPSFRTDQMRSDIVLFYELDENGPGGHWNDGANRPSEFITLRHNGGGTFSRIDGSAKHVQFLDYFDMLNQTPGPLWCNPLTRDGKLLPAS